MGISSAEVMSSAAGLQRCGITTTACSTTTSMQSTLTLPNLNSSFVQSNQPAVLQALGSDISAATGGMHHNIVLLTYTVY